MKRLKKVALDFTRLCDVIFLAEVEGDGFADLIITTSKAHRQDCATEIALARGTSISRMDVEIGKIEQRLKLEEFVEVQDQAILVVVNVGRINDHVVNRVLLTLMEIPEFTLNKRIKFDGTVKTEPNNFKQPSYSYTS